ncbi:MAG: hypothetical protein ABW043_16765 [Devosia sp.]|uniref:hypothetical protein n=1 Tax=Devosia sp. TaxID=1871048 RepID=UPI0033978956
MNLALAFNSMVCAAAVIAAAHAPASERRAAVICAASLFPIWALYSLSFEYSTNPAHFASMLLGFKVKSPDLWSSYDLIGGIIPLILARRLLWGRLLSATFFAELILHWMRKHGYVERVIYYALLDFGFYAQGAIFLALGGGGIGRNIALALRRFRSRGLSPLLETQQKRALIHGRA